MKTLTAAILFFFSCNLLQAQGMLTDLVDPNLQNPSLLMSGGKYKDILGSPFLFDTWLMGEVVSENGQKFPNVKMKYDAFNDQLLMEHATELPLVVEKKQVGRFSFFSPEDNLTYHFLKAKLGGPNSLPMYLQVIHEGRFMVVKRYRKMINENNPLENGGYGAVKRNDEFVKTERYYIQTGESGFQELNLQKKKFIEQFSAKSTEIKAFLKKEKINLKEHADLVKTIKYLEGIF